MTTENFKFNSLKDALEAVARVNEHSDFVKVEMIFVDVDLIIVSMTYKEVIPF